MADVFISYSRDDRPVAERLAAALDAQGISYWMDSHLAGGSTFTDVTEEELNKAGKVIVLWSATSIKSGWVKDEAQAAREQGKLVPLTIDGSQPPMGFRQIQTVDVSAWATGKQSDLPPGVLHGLEHTAAASEPGAAPRTAKPAASRRTLLLAALGAIILLLGSVFAWTQWGGGPTGSSGHSAEVMVMPFTAIGDDPDGAALAAGITQELIVRLRQVEGLRVLTGANAAGGVQPAFSGNRIDGTVQLVGEDLHVSPTLTNGQGAVLWSQNFDTRLNGLLQVQQSVAREVAKALSVSLDIGTDSRAYGGTSNPDAYTAYVQGMSFALTDTRKSAGLFERAVALDPGYVKALAALSISYGAMSFRQQEGERRAIERMDQTSSRALAENPELWIGHNARGRYYALIGDYLSADAEYRRTAELNPGNDLEALVYLAQNVASLGRVQEAIDLSNSIKLVDPSIGLPMFEQNYLFMAGRLDEAADPKWPDTATYFGIAPPTFWIALIDGDSEKAGEIAKNIVEQRGSETGQMYIDAANSGLDPKYLPDLPPAELQRWAESKFASPIDTRLGLADRAYLAGFLGKEGLALKYLRLAVTRYRNYGLSELWHPTLARTRETPEFVQLVTDLGLVEAWRKSGDWGDFCSEDVVGKVTCH